MDARTRRDSKKKKNPTKNYNRWGVVEKHDIPRFEKTRNIEEKFFFTQI